METFVETNWARLRVLRDGQGPPVVLLHGYLFGADWWRPQIAALSDRHATVAVDLRGQMGSPPTPDGYGLWNQAEDIRGLIEQLQLGPAHLVGLSMGGMIALRLALAHPQLVRSLVLMDTSADAELPEVRERNRGLAEVFLGDGIAAVRPALPSIFLDDSFITEHRDQVDAWLDRLAESDPVALVEVLRAIDARDDLRPRLGEIRVPVLVIHGREEAVFPEERAREIAAGIPGARVELVNGAHQSNVDAAEETSDHIRTFLEGLESGG